MSHFFNARLAKCVNRILPAIKYVLTNNNKRAIEFPNSKQSALTFKRYILPNHTVATKSIIFGFSLYGFIGINESEKDRKLIDMIRKGELYLQNENYDAFEQTLQEALKMAKDSKNAVGITQVYDALANGAFMKKEYEKAKGLFIKVIQRLFKHGCLKDDLNILYIYLKISKIDEFLKDYKKSKFGYIYCMENLEEKIQIDPENKDVLALYAMTLDAYGHYLINQGEIQKAKIILGRAYKASVKSNGEIFKKNAILLNDLSTLYFAQGNYTRALQYLKKAEQIGQSVPDLKILSMIYINRGYIYFKQGLLKEAEQNCVKGMDNAKRHSYNKGKKEAEICLAAIKNAMK